VDKVHHWPGVNGLGALLAGRPLRADRPWHFYRRGGVMPEAVELRLAIPGDLGPEAEVLAELRQRVAATEIALATERARTGTRVYGRRAVLKQSCWSRPASVEPRRNLRPRVAARSKWARIEALQRNQDFVEDYTTAREAWKSGAKVHFPAGTYWLRRHAHVLIAAT
jgi:putative transposase